MTDLEPQVSVQVELDVYLVSPDRESKPVLFHGEGKVVRTVESAPKAGFAAEVLFQTEGPERLLFEYEGTIQ